MTDKPSPGLFRRLAEDRSGLSAIEFALLAPIIIFFYFGMVEFCQAFMAQKRMSHASSMIGDLVAQSTEAVTPAEVDDIFEIGQLIMRPFDAGPLELRVSSVTRDASGQVRVDWSRGFEALGRTDPIDIPDDLIANGESLIVSTARYRYDSPVGYVIEDGVVFDQTHYLRPRAVETVVCADC